MDKPRLLDLFCGAGGAAMGYSRAGFEVVGVDINPQPHYPFRFILADALTYPIEGYVAIHASPPCQSYTRKRSSWGRERTNFIEHPDLLAVTRDKLLSSKLPYVIENVEGSPIKSQVMLCGSMFKLNIHKHRYFESNKLLGDVPGECSRSVFLYNPWSGPGRTIAKFREAQGTPWIPMAGGASRKRGITGDLYNAIPPAYTEWIGGRIMRVLNG